MKTKFSHKVLSCVVAIAMMAGLAIPAFATDANAPAPTGTTPPEWSDLEYGIGLLPDERTEFAATLGATDPTHELGAGENNDGYGFTVGAMGTFGFNVTGTSSKIANSQAPIVDGHKLDFVQYIKVPGKRIGTEFDKVVLKSNGRETDNHTREDNGWINNSKDGHCYIKGGVYFADYINGKWQRRADAFFQTIEFYKDGANVYTASFTIKLDSTTVPLIIPVTAGEITALAPVPTEPVASYAPPTHDNVTVSNVKWKPDTRFDPDTTDGFAYNTPYTISFTIKPNTGYTLDGLDSSNLSISGVKDSKGKVTCSVADSVKEEALISYTFPATVALDFNFINYCITTLEARIARAVKDKEPKDVPKTQECISTEYVNRLKTSIAFTKTTIKDHVEWDLKQSAIDVMANTLNPLAIDALGFFQTGTKGGVLTLEDQNIAINAALNAKAGVVSVKLGTKEAEIDLGVKFVSFGDMNFFNAAILPVQEDIDAKSVNEKNIINLYNAIDTLKALIKTGTKPSSYNPSTVPTTNGSGSTGSTGTTTTTSGNAPVTSSSFEGAKADMSDGATNEDGKPLTDPKVKIDLVDLTDPDNLTPEVKGFVLAAEGFGITDILDINLFDGTTPVKKLANGKLRVTIPFERSPEVPADAEYFILHDNGDGTVTRIPATISEDGKSISFETNQYSLYAVAVISDDMNLFNDINVDPIVVPEVKPTTPTNPTTPTTPIKPVIKPSLNPATGVSLLGQLF